MNDSIIYVSCAQTDHWHFGRAAASRIAMATPLDALGLGHDEIDVPFSLCLRVFYLIAVGPRSSSCGIQSEGHVLCAAIWMQRLCSVAVITSGSDASSSSRRAYPSPGDPGSIPGKTYCFASDLYITFVFLLIFSM